MADPTPLTRVDVVPPATVLPAAVAADNTNGNTVVNDGNTSLVFENGTGAQTVVLETSATVGGLAVADKTLNLAANTKYRVPASALPVSLYGTLLKFTASAATVLVRAENVV